MNLWTLFPESLIQIKGILNLPYVAVSFYLYTLYGVYKHKEHRQQLLIFIALSFAASLTMFTSLGPSIGLFWPPLLLILVMLLPMLILFFQIREKDIMGIWVWSITTIAGWLHSLSWWLWLYALSNS